MNSRTQISFYCRQRQAGLTACLLVLLMLLQSCVGSRQTTQQRSSGPFLTTLREWPEAYQDNFFRIQHFTGKARVTVESTEFSGSFSMEVNWTAPDHLALKAEGPLGIDIGQVFIGQNRFVVYNQHDNHYTSGSVDDPYLNRFQGTSFTLQDLKYAVLGQAYPSVGTVRLDDDLHGIFISDDDDIRLRYLVNPESGLLESCEAIRNGSVFLRQEFQNYRKVDGLMMPNVVIITLLEQKERISIFYRSMKLNVPVSPLKYAVDISSKVEQLNLE